MSDYGAPAPYGGQPPALPPMGEPPDNNLIWGILTTIFCCLPLGVVSIVFAAQVNSKWQAGDAAGARDSAAKARQWAIWSAVIAAVLAVLGVLITVVLGVALIPLSADGY